MATKIILTTHEELNEEEVEALKFLFSDALSEFASVREPASDYVHRRHANNFTSTSEDSRNIKIQDKVKQVQSRIDLANKLHGAALNFEVVNDEEPSRLTERARIVFNGGNPRVLVSAAYLRKADAKEVGEHIIKLAESLPEGGDRLIFTVKEVP